MADLTIYVCDECNAQLTGRVGTAEIKKSYISMKGSVSKQFVNPRTGQRDHCFISHKDQKMLTFCDTTCFASFIERREKDYAAYQERLLREEADGNDTGHIKNYW